MKARAELERLLTGKVLMDAAEAKRVIRTYAGKKQMSKMDLLLIEGAEAGKLLGEMSRYVRAQNEIDLGGFLQGLGNVKQATWETKFWNLLIR